MDVYRDEQQGAVVAKASMPGFEKDEIEINVTDGVLSIRGEHQEEQETKDDQYIRRERRFGVVHRRVALPGAVQDDKTQAELKDGVLTVTVPFAEESAPKRIDIKVG
jgi:HSP20 family protein